VKAISVVQRGEQKLVKCREVKSVMSDWLDGLLPERQPEVQAHLDDCLPCSYRVQEMKQVLNALCKLKQPVAPPPLDFSEQVMARLRMEQLKPARHFFRIPLRSLALAASILFLFGINGLLLSSYGNGGLIGRALAPFTDSTPAAQHSVVNPVRDRMPLQKPLEEGAPNKPAEAEDVLPAEVPHESTPVQPSGVPAIPLVEQPAAIAIDGRQKRVAAPVKKETPGNMTAQGSTLQDSPAEAKKVQVTLPPTPQPEQVSLQELVLSAPQIFVNRKRVTESTVVRINVQQLGMASQMLASSASLQGATPTMEDTILTQDGRLIRLHQFEVPFERTNQFVAGTTLLGKLIAEEQFRADITGDYAEKLTYYEQLAKQRLVAGGEEAERLNRTINELLSQMARMDRNARTTQNVIVWLES